MEEAKEGLKIDPITILVATTSSNINHLHNSPLFCSSLKGSNSILFNNSNSSSNSSLSSP